MALWYLYYKEGNVSLILSCGSLCTAMAELYYWKILLILPLGGALSPFSHHFVVFCSLAAFCLLWSCVSVTKLTMLWLHLAGCMLWRWLLISIRAFSSVVAPLASFIREEPKFLKFFIYLFFFLQKLKDCFTSAHILYHPDPSLPLKVDVDEL